MKIELSQVNSKERYKLLLNENDILQLLLNSTILLESANRDRPEFEIELEGEFCLSKLVDMSADLAKKDKGDTRFTYKSF